MNYRHRGTGLDRAINVFVREMKQNLCFCSELSVSFSRHKWIINCMHCTVSYFIIYAFNSSCLSGLLAKRQWTVKSKNDAVKMGYCQMINQRFLPRNFLVIRESKTFSLHISLLNNNKLYTTMYQLPNAVCGNWWKILWWCVTHIQGSWSFNVVLTNWFCS